MQQAKQKTHTPAKVIVVDDHDVVRRGLQQVIDEDPALTICGNASNTRDALQILDTTDVDVMTIDLSLGEDSGLELIKDIKARHNAVLMLVYSMHDESLYAERAIRAGARGYLMKQEPVETVVEAIHRILTGRVYLSAVMASRMVDLFLDGPDATSDTSSLNSLSDRELEIFQLIGQGMGTRLIAERLHLSMKTIETHRSHIKRKLKLKDGYELVQQAVQWVQSQ